MDLSFPFLLLAAGVGGLGRTRPWREMTARVLSYFGGRLGKEEEKKSGRVFRVLALPMLHVFGDVLSSFALVSFRGRGAMLTLNVGLAQMPRG